MFSIPQVKHYLESLFFYIKVYRLLFRCKQNISLNLTINLNFVVKLKIGKSQNKLVNLKNGNKNVLLAGLKFDLSTSTSSYDLGSC